MCGIVGYLGPRDLDEVLLQGLRRLEYRGYDSAGLAGIADGGGVSSVRAVGNLDNLEAALSGNGGLHASSNGSGSHTGIGHTRWATHGKVTEANAHPHFDSADRIHVVVNGIVENFAELRARLIAGGATFTSETDVEVIAHLIASYGDIDLLEGVRKAVGELEGHFAFVAMSADEPGRLVAFRKECPLVIGQGDGELFLGSAIPAFLRYTRQAIAIDTETTTLDPQQAELVGVSLCVEPGKACYIPIAHCEEGDGDLFGGGRRIAGQLPLGEVLDHLKADAKKRALSVHELAAKIVEAVGKDQIVGAVIDG